uniref:Uncharacterized protein n=1 Tax=Eptatretus burgeri TaxID=7764 RepID=A0A8C4QPU9_EPTBU
MWEGALLTLFVLVSTSACVLVFMVFGWYVVWRCFLSKFRFLRELVGDRGAQMPGATGPTHCGAKPREASENADKALSSCLHLRLCSEAVRLAANPRAASLVNFMHC